MSSVLVTGASRGIGRALAVELAGRGHRVIATARRPETLAELPVSRRLPFERLFQLHTVGAVRVAQGVLPAMRTRGAGHLVFVSSILGRVVLPLISPCGAGKWALEALAETLAVEVGHSGVK